MKALVAPNLLLLFLLPFHPFSSSYLSFSYSSTFLLFLLLFFRPLFLLYNPRLLFFFLLLSSPSSSFMTPSFTHPPFPPLLSPAPPLLSTIRSSLSPSLPSSSFPVFFLSHLTPPPLFPRLFPTFFSSSSSSVQSSPPFLSFSSFSHPLLHVFPLHPFSLLLLSSAFFSFSNPSPLPPPFHGPHPPPLSSLQSSSSSTSSFSISSPPKPFFPLLFCLISVPFGWVVGAPAGGNWRVTPDNEMKRNGGGEYYTLKYTAPGALSSLVCEFPDR